MSAYYNEIDPFAAQWLRNLVVAGHIAAGDVDERSIAEVKPEDLKGYTQCHFFAGIGVWSYSLIQAGWCDNRPVWTGSCPCQPFSQAGKQRGDQDERHLWPAWYELIRECKPEVVFGEQVASAEVVGKIDGSGENVWIDVVQADLERASYAQAQFDLPASGFGAPHIRQRCWFVAQRLANTYSTESQQPTRQGAMPDQEGAARTHRKSDRRSDADRLGHTSIQSSKRNTRELPKAQGASSSERCPDGDNDNGHSDAGKACRLANSHSTGRQQRSQAPKTSRQGNTAITASGCPEPTYEDNSFWSDPDWLGCRDGKFRPVEPGTCPLANGITSRVGRLRAYGNAICAPVATEFIRAYMERL